MWYQYRVVQRISHSPPDLVAVRIHSSSEFGLDAYPKAFTACKGRENSARIPAYPLIVPPPPPRANGPFMAAWPRGLCSDVACRVALQNDAARLRGLAVPLGRALEGGRATFGPPLQHRPYQEHNSQARQLIEMEYHFITTRHAASLLSSRNGIA